MRGDWRAGVLLALAWTVLGFLVLPVAVVFPLSVTDTSYLAMPQDGLSLRHWRELVESPAWRGAFQDSLLIAAASSALAVAAGTLAAIGCWRLSSWLGEGLRVLLLLPLIVPTVVYALGAYRLYATLGLLDSYTGVILAHTCIGLPYVVITAGAALSTFDPRLEQAARNLGASGRQAIRLVLLPHMLPGIVSGAIFAFVNSWDELVIVLFIASRRVSTVPRQVWDGINESLDPAIAAAAVALILATVVLLLPVLRSGGPATGARR